MLESRIAEAVSGARIIDKPGFGSLDLADILLARNDKGTYRDRNGRTLH